MSVMNWITILWFAIGIPVSFVVVYHFVRRRHQNGPAFPDLSEVDVRFRESGASGRSELSFRTKSSGARNMLNVVVTQDELWIGPHFGLFASFLETIFHVGDLLHRVPIGNVHEIQGKGRRVTVRFARPEGGEAVLNIMLKRPAEFVEAVRAGRHPEASV